MKYKKSYGQHILTSDTIARSMVDERGVDMQASDTVLEIGPGTGVLTKEILSRKVKRLIAIEKDPEMVTHLKDLFSSEIESGQLMVREEDALEYNPTDDGLTGGGYVLVANIPYYITGALIRRYLAEVPHPSKTALMVQKEVADRITQSENGSILSNAVRAYGTPQKTRIVKAGSFVPPPQIDSAILLITAISKKRFEESGVSEKHLFNILKTGFKERRKQLKNNLSQYNDRELETVFGACGIPKKARAEELSVDDWFCLARNLSQQQPIEVSIPM